MLWRCLRRLHHGGGVYELSLGRWVGEKGCSSLRKAGEKGGDRSLWGWSTSREWSAVAGAGQHNGVCKR